MLSFNSWKVKVTFSTQPNISTVTSKLKSIFQIFGNVCFKTWKFCHNLKILKTGKLNQFQQPIHIHRCTIYIYVQSSNENINQATVSWKQEHHLVHGFGFDKGQFHDWYSSKINYKAIFWRRLSSLCRNIIDILYSMLLKTLKEPLKNIKLL